MPEHDEAIINREIHHEGSDVNVRPLVWFVAAFLAVAVIGHVSIWFLYRYFRDVAARQTTAPLTAIKRPAGIEMPPEPRLQPLPSADPTGQVPAPYAKTPVVDLQQMRADEDQALKTAAWIDQQKGIVRLPIDLAKQLVVQQGLPVVESKP